MPLNIKNEEAHKMARELAELKRTTITEAVMQALRDAIERSRAHERNSRDVWGEELREIAEITSNLRSRDRRSTEEILGYDENGIPGS